MEGRAETPRGCCSSVPLARHPWASSSTISPNLRTSLVSGFHLPRRPFLVESPKTKCIIWANNSLILFLENGAARQSLKLSFLKYICSEKGQVLAEMAEMGCRQLNASCVGTKLV